MRDELKKLAGQEISAKAKIEKFGKRLIHGYIPAITVLLSNVRTNSGNPLASHLWIRNGGFAERMKIGTEITFTATVIPYARGKHIEDETKFNVASSNDIDYTLTKIRDVMAFRPVSFLREDTDEAKEV